MEPNAKLREALPERGSPYHAGRDATLLKMRERIALDELLEHVIDRESFLAFAQALMIDYRDEVEREKTSPSSPYGPGVNGWENGSIDAYLEAAISWTEDWIGRENELPQEPSWKSFASFCTRENTMNEELGHLGWEF